MEGKSEQEVRDYSAVFWARHQELNDWERVIKNIERGEQRIQRQTDIMSAIEAKMDRYRNPWQELRLQYGANKGKAYTGAPSLLNILQLVWCCICSEVEHVEILDRDCSAMIKGLNTGISN